jgi:PAS domain S-box-containing protein
MQTRVDDETPNTGTLSESSPKGDRLVALVEQLPSPVALLDADLRVLAASRQWREHYAMNDNALIGTSFLDIVEDGSGQWADALEIARQGRVYRAEELPLNRRNGRSYRVRCELRPWFDGRGTMQGLMLFGENRTEQRIAREAVERATARFRGIFDSMYQLMWLLRPDGIIVEANRAALEFARVTREEALGRKMWEVEWFGPTESASNRIEDGVRMAATGEFFRASFVFPDASGHSSTIDLSINPITDADGRVTLLIPEGRNITDQRNAEALLDEERQFLKSLLATSPSAVIACDASGSITLFNEAAGKLLGREDGDASVTEADVFEKFYHPDTNLPFSKNEHPLVRALEGEKVSGLEMVVRRAHAPDVFVIAGGCQLKSKDDAVLGAFVLLYDITERTRVEDELRRSESQQAAIISALPDGLARVRRDGTILAYHPSTEFEPSIAPEAFMGRRFHDLLPASLRDRATAAIDAVLTDGSDRELFHYEVEIEGERRHREARVVKGGEDEVVFVLRDLTEQVIAERTIRRSRELLNRVLESSLDGIMAFRSIRDRQGRIVDFEWLMANSRSSDITGRAAEQLIGRRLLMEMPGNRDSGLFDSYVRVVESGEPFFTLVRYEADGINTWLSITATRVEDGFAVTFRDIGEQIETESALRESQDQLSRAQEIAHLGSWSYDPEKGVVAWSDELFRIYGMDPNEGIDFERYVARLHPEDRDWMLPVIWRSIETGEPYVLVHRIVRKDGTVRVVRGAGEPIVRNGKVVRIIGTGHDITEQHEAEQALKRREAESRAIIKALPDVLIRIRRDGVVMKFVAPEGFFEGEVPNIEGQSVWDFGDETLARMASSHIDEVLDTGVVSTFEYDLEIKGRRFFREVRVSPYDSEEVLMVLRDITQRVAAERALRESEQRFRLLAENMSDLVCLHQTDGRYTYVSPSSVRILGYEPDDLVGRDPYELVHPDDIERLRESAHRPALDGASPLTIQRMRRSDGEYIWLESAVKPIEDSEGNLVRLLTSSRDVTERVLAEQAMERANKSLEQRNRELQDFAYVASHDLQEPLRKIRAFTDLLREEYADSLDETGDHYLERVHDAAYRMARLITDLLAFSRVTTRAKDFEDVDLGELTQDVLQDLEIAIEESGAIVEIGPLPTIEAERTQMQQLMQNLIGNAVKFRSPDDSPRVAIRARKGKRTLPGRVTIPTWRIEVTDAGIGFDEKYLDKIFTPFQRLHTRSNYAGTGMGLAICRRIVERHGGTITARSVIGQGSTFIVELPARQPENSENE